MEREATCPYVEPSVSQRDGPITSTNTCPYLQAGGQRMLTRKQPSTYEVQHVTVLSNTAGCSQCLVEDV